MYPLKKIVAQTQTEENSKMKKTAVLVLVLVLIVSFAACGGKKTSDAFDDSVVKEKAENVISFLNSRDYASVEYMVRDDVKEKLSAQVLTDALDPILDQAGDFKEFASEAVTGSKGSDSEEYAIAVIKAVYEKQTFIYTITFDRDYKVAGLYIK